MTVCCDAPSPHPSTVSDNSKCASYREAVGTKRDTAGPTSLSFSLQRIVLRGLPQRNTGRLGGGGGSRQVTSTRGEGFPGNVHVSRCKGDDHRDTVPPRVHLARFLHTPVSTEAAISRQRPSAEATLIGAAGSAPDFSPSMSILYFLCAYASAASMSSGVM